MKTYKMAILFLVLVFGYISSVAQSVVSNNFAHTFSIVARDTVTGEIGVAVQTHSFAVGNRVSWAEAGIGAIATQSFTNKSFGPRGLEYLREGCSAEETLEKLIDSDFGKDVRQVGIIDNNGNVATWTGKKCIREAGHISGNNFSVQANMMLTDQVWSAMAEAFESTKAPLAERLIASLEAAQSVGGDIRGIQAAAMKVVSGKSTGNYWEGVTIDLRVDDSKDPIKELARLLKVQRANEHLGRGEVALEKGDLKTAIEENSIAQDMLPEDLEVKYWYAVSLANNNMVEMSLPIFKEVFAKDNNWKILTERLPEVDLLRVGKSELREILAQ
ncbi:MAG: DUF1028 domain-containing protein [Bacteroidetes bacterium]|nr:DUF1028 domain-containing protein [Bacteroidota bacterium]